MVMAREPEGVKFELIPAGNHLARCFAVVDLGVHEKDWQGQKSYARQVRLAFECPQELMTEGDFKGQPFSISKHYTLSLSEKANLRKDLESWRGRAFSTEELNGFNLDNLIGVPCMVNVVHKTSEAGKTYAKLTSITPVPKGMDVPEGVNKPVLFDLDAPDADEQYRDLPEWLQKMINMELPQGQSSEDFDDDIPFS